MHDQQDNGGSGEGGWIDVSVPLKSGMVCWPGDPAVVVEQQQAIARGDMCNVTRLDFGAHTGTHVDAPLHFIDGDLPVQKAPLDAYIGPARVLHLPDVDVVRAADLAPFCPQRDERLLLKTRNSQRVWHREPFDERFVALSLDAAELLAQRQVRTVGIDYLSVSGYRDDAMAIHRALLEARVWIIEGLQLAQVSPGVVDLVCLPLRLAEADGAPARVVVRPRSRSL
jgi:arylformamidase